MANGEVKVLQLVDGTAVTPGSAAPSLPMAYLDLTEGTAPANPASGDHRIYVKTSDGEPYLRNSAGTEEKILTAVTGLLNPMSAAGDVIVGGAAGATTRLDTTKLGDISASSNSATVTLTIASPCVVTLSAHGLATGAKVYLTTTGALPTGLTASTVYYVIVASSSTFQLATSLANALAGTAINTTGSQSGTHTAFYGGLVLASGVKGSYAGSSVASGYVGEVVSGSAIVDSTSLSTSYSDVSTMSLTAGVWMIWYELQIAAANGSSTNNLTVAQCHISDNSNTRIGSSERLLQPPANVSAVSITVVTSLRATEIVTPSTTTTYKLRAGKSNFNGTGVATYYNSTSSGQSVFKAARIA